jgi:hypothetical protein
VFQRAEVVVGQRTIGHAPSIEGLTIGGKVTDKAILGPPHNVVGLDNQGTAATIIQHVLHSSERKAVA